MVDDAGVSWVVDERTIEQLRNAMPTAMAILNAELAQMSENGKRLIQEKYTWPAVAKQMSAFYERLV